MLYESVSNSKNLLIISLSLANYQNFYSFFCENDTRLTWEMVEAQLIDYENSNHDFKVISINELFQAAKILSENIVSNINDLCFNLYDNR